MERMKPNKLAQRIVDQIRSDPDGLSPDLCERASNYPLVDMLRALVVDADEQVVMALCESQSRPHSTLGFYLLDRLTHRASVHKYLIGKWNALRPDADIKTRVVIQFKLLDYPKISRNLSRDLWNFTTSSWDSWLSHCVRWCGGLEAVLPFCESRLARCGQPREEGGYPLSKRWAYLCAALASTDKDGVRKMLMRYADPFLARVAKDLLDRV